MVRKRFKQAIFIALVLGTLFSLAILVLRNNLLQVLYKTTNGSDYIKILGPVFVLFYLEGPLTSTLQAIGKSSQTFKISTIGIILKLSLMSLFAFLKLGIYSLIYAEIINIFIVVALSSWKVKKELF